LKGANSVPGKIQAADIMILKPFEQNKESYSFINTVIVVCLNDGTLNIYDLAGELLYRYKTGHKHLFCAATQSTDEMLIATIDKTEIKVHHIEMHLEANSTITATDQEFGLKCSKAKFTVSLLSSGILFNGTNPEPTAFSHYSRLGKKYWIVGDSDGFINVYHYNGEIYSRGSTGLSTIKTLDRSGQQLAYAGDKTLGIYNLGSMEPHIICDPGIYNITDISIDFTSSIVHAAFENGEIFTYDTRFTANNVPTHCKAIARLVNKHGGPDTKLVSVKGSLLAWGDGVLTNFNTSFLDGKPFLPPAYFTLNQLPQKESPLIKGFKLSLGGHYLAIASSDRIAAYEIIAPKYKPQVASESFDFSNLRIIAIGLAIIGIVIYKAKTRKSRPQQEVEKLEKGLEDLQRTINQTNKMSEDMTRKLRDVESEAKKTVRFNENLSYNYPNSRIVEEDGEYEDYE